MLDLKERSADVLRRYEANLNALELIQQQIQENEISMTGIRNIQTDDIPVKNSRDVHKNRVINHAEKRDILKVRLLEVQTEVNMVNRGLSVLDQKERKFLERFYISKRRGAASELAEEYFTDTRTVFKWRDKALYKFTIALYGFTEWP